MYPRKEIMRRLWGGFFFGESRAADVHVQHLRATLEPDPKKPRYVLTMRTKGTMGPSPLEGNRAALLRRTDPLFTGVRGRGVLRTSP
jgi:hypothetical protein